MRSLEDFDGVFLHRDVIDMRRSIDGLSAIVRHEMQLDLTEKYLFVFVGRSKDRLKILYWDRTGFSLWYKRLEKSKFPWPKSGDSVRKLAPKALGWILDGIDIFKIKPHESVPLDKNW
jgi:transposase